MAIATAFRPIYVPWPTRTQRGSTGTWSQHCALVGDTSGGSVTIQLKASRNEFGFPALFVVKYHTAHDGNPSAGAVLMDVGAGARSLGRTGIAVDCVRLVGQNYTRGDALTGNYPLIEPDVDDLVIAATTWSVNTNSADYHMVIGGLVFDVQDLAKRGWPMGDPY